MDQTHLDISEHINQYVVIDISQVESMATNARVMAIIVWRSPSLIFLSVIGYIVMIK